MVGSGEEVKNRNDPEVPEILAVLLCNSKASLFGPKYFGKQFLSFSLRSLPGLFRFLQSDL